MKNLLLLWVALAIGGCASYDGRGLVPGASTGSQVEALMGSPALRVTRPDGSTVLYFPRSPQGRHVYAATVGPDGVLRELDQRLTWANINRLMAGTTTAKDAREIFGPPYPYTISRMPFKPLEVWEYRWLDVDDKRVLWLHFSDDGILREVINTHDFEADEPSGAAGTMP